MSLSAPIFDIYHASDRYRAVEDELARHILATLQADPLGLDALSEEVGASRDDVAEALEVLVDQDLVTPETSEGPFRLAGTPIGSSVISRSELRQAVRSYVSTHTGGGRFPLVAALQALSESPGDDRASTLWAQGDRLGSYVGQRLIQEGDHALDGIPELLIREGILERTTEADPDGLGTFSPGQAAPEDLDARLFGHLVGGFLEGCLTAREAPAARVELHLDEPDGTFTLHLGGT